MNRTHTTNTSLPNNTLALSTRHKNYLEHDAKIKTEIQSAAGLFTCDQNLSKDLIGFEQSGIMFPYYNLHGDMINLRLRLDNPGADANGKKIRYLQSKDASLTCYFLKRNIQNILLPTIPLVIVEGEKKLLCVESNVKFEHPVAVLSYPGCWSFKKKDEAGLADSWNEIPLNGRSILWVPDSDFFYNDSVFRAGETFVRLLVSAGANVDLVDLRSPEVDKNQKIGADDFIIRTSGLGFLNRLSNPSWSFSETTPLTITSSEALLEYLKLRILTPPAEVEKLLQQTSDQIGQTLQSVKLVWREAVREWHNLRAQKSTSSRNRRDISIDGDIPRKEIIDEISRALKEDGRFYRYSDELLLVEQEKRDLMGPDSLPGKLIDLSIEFVKENKKAGGFSYVLLPANHSQALFHSNSLRGSLDEIVLFANHPIYDRNWQLAKPGYNPEEKIYYSGSEIRPIQSLRLINEIIKDFLFRDEASRANYLSFLLTAILRNKYRGARPLGAFTGNKPQLGKTLAGRVISLIAEGLPPQTTSYNKNQEEFEKQIGAKARTRDVLFIDNAKSNLPIESAVLERTITDDPISFRLLGRSETISRPNTLVFMISMNDAQFCLDITRRALPISFFLAEDIDPSRIKYNHLSLEDFVKENRTQILQELCGMVETWKEAGRPISKKDFRFRSWAEDVGGILLANGFTAFLDNLETAYSEYDKTSHEIGRLFEDHLDKPLTAVELTKICMQENLFPELFENAKKATTSLSHLLTKYLGKRIPLPNQNSCILKEGRWNPSLKVKTFVAASGTVPGTTGTTVDPEPEGPRDLTGGNNSGKGSNPGTTGTEKLFEENASTLVSSAKTNDRSALAENPQNVPVVPGNSVNPLGTTGDLVRAPVPLGASEVPAPGLGSPDNDLEWQ